MKKVRILALHLAYGGIEKAIISLANLLCERYEVEIVSVYRMPGSPAFPLDGRVRVRYLLEDVPNRREWKEAVRSGSPAAIWRESARSVKILAGKKRAVRETVRSVHDGALITTRHEDNLALSRYGDKNVLKIAQLHQDHRFDRRLLAGIRKRYGNIDVFALLTPELAGEIRELLGPAEKPEVIDIPNFLDRLPEDVDLRAKEKLVAAVGRLDAVKGFDRLISCFARVHASAPDWKLTIVGEGEEREKLEALTAQLGLEDCVSLPGKTDGPGVEAVMRRASLFAMSSHSEGFPFVLLEALSCALPAVAFDVRVGPRAIIRQDSCGLLIPDGDEEAFAAALLRLMGDAPLRRRMAERALARAEDFSREKIAERWFALLER